MKKSFLLLPLIGVFAYITLCSDSNGKSGNLTGSVASSTGCGSCHGSSAVAGISVNFELDSMGVPVTKYKPGGVYVLKMIGTNTTSSSQPKFGFQMVTVMGTGTTQAGAWSTVPTGASLHTSSGLSVMGHNTPNSPTTGTGATGTIYVVTAGWTAPVAGSGTVTVHGVLNAVNANGSDDAGDKWNTGSATFQERIVPSSVETIATPLLVNVFPNPVSEFLTLQLDNNVSGTYHISVFDLGGRLMTTQMCEETTTVLHTADWAPGIYLLNITNGNCARVITVAKQ